MEKQVKVENRFGRVVFVSAEIAKKMVSKNEGTILEQVKEEKKTKKSKKDTTEQSE